jgi:hypothetical protein
METPIGVMGEAHPNALEKIRNETSLFNSDPETAYKEAQRLVNVVSSNCTGPRYISMINGKAYTLALNGGRLYLPAWGFSRESFSPEDLIGTMRSLMKPKLKFIVTAKWSHPVKPCAAIENPDGKMRMNMQFDPWPSHERVGSLTAFH